MYKKRKNQATDLMSQNLILFLNEVIAHNPERGIVKQMDCPVCGAEETVRYTRANCNGHIHAYCDACGMNMTE